MKQLLTISWLPILLLVGCAPLQIPADPPEPPPVVVIEEDPAPVPIVREVEPEAPQLKAQSEFFCAKPKAEKGTYYGVVDDIHIRLEIIQYGTGTPECYMYFNKFTIVDDKCDGVSSELYTPSIRFQRTPPILIDWKKVDKVLKLGHRLACKENLGDNNNRLAEIESESVFKLFRGIK